MNRSMWLMPWDVSGRDPEQLLDELQGTLKLDRVRLALSYHGGRMVLPRHPSRMVVEHSSAVYADVPLEECGALRPRVGDEAAAVEAFLSAAKRRRFPVLGWTVLCHRDDAPVDACFRNAFGERYSFALCPSNPEVQQYVVGLCRALSTCDVAGLDLEALSYMGLEHQSLHDKRGFALPAHATHALSICCCDHCRHELGMDIRESLCSVVRSNTTVSEHLVGALVEMRRRVLGGLLQRVREATGTAVLNLRTALDPRALGGKTALPIENIRRVVDEVTITFFGVPAERMAQELADVPPGLHGGFVFHGPDCSSADDVARRLDLLSHAGIDEVAFYSYSMASDEQLSWISV